jgi:UDP-GlcNAc:undecaprenyl-phosphate GlcNAc-1-phosphate transferase
MKTILSAMVVATATSAALTPVVRRLGIRVGAVSHPGGRHIHQTPIPRLGGLSIGIAFFAPLLLLCFVKSSVATVFRAEAQRSIGLLLGAILMTTVGALDDWRGVRALYKLYVQIAAGVIAFAFGFRIGAVQLPVVGVLEMGVFELPITVLWIIAIVNAVNLIDGLDGLAGGVVFFAAFTNLVVAYLSNSVFVSLLMASLLGAVLGFLFYNFNPARIFMGDSGSYFLGFILATSSITGQLQKASTAVALLVPIVSLGVPILDTMLAIVRRFLQRRSIFSPDRGHIHHRLLDMGLTHRRAVLLIYGVCLTFASAAIAIALGRSWQVGAALLGSSLAVVALVRFVGYFRHIQELRSIRERVGDPTSERLRGAVVAFVRRSAGFANADDAWAEIGDFAKKCQLTSLAIVRAGTVEGVRVWGGAADVERDQVIVTVPLARPTGSELRVSWGTEHGEASLESQVLLRLVASVFSDSMAAEAELATLRVDAEPVQRSVQAETHVEAISSLKAPGQIPSHS